MLRPASVGGSIATDTRKSSLSVGSNPSYCGGSSTFPWAVRDSIPAWEPASVPVRRVHSSAVEHWIADPMVTGSIPVVPSFGAVMRGSLRVVKGAGNRGGVLAQEAINERVMCKQMPFDC